MDAEGRPGKEDYEVLFEQLYSDFEGSGFDLGMSSTLQGKVWDHFEQFKVPNKPYPHEPYTWRLFLEFVLSRISKDDIILRELLFERVRDTWERQRLVSRIEEDRRLLQGLEQGLKRSLDHAVDRIFDELKAYQVITQPKVIRREDGGVISPVSIADKDYKFGTVKNGVLLWNGVLNQLARAIYLVQSQLGYEGWPAGAIIKHIEEKGKIKLTRGTFVTVKQDLDKLHKDTQGFGTKPTTPEAAGVILALMKE